MRRRLHLSIAIVVVSFFVWARAVEVRAAEGPRPNVVLIMTDNHAAWTLGCYGNEDIQTPNIDRLAKEGTLLTRCFSSNPVCSPTRATYLTGLLPSQHGVHCYLGAGGAQIGPKAYCTIGEFRTLPRILAESGYTCGLSGKWHLGDNLHPQEGFTSWITTPHGHTTTFYDADVIEDARVRKEPEYLTDLWTDHAVRFIERNKDRPFFLFLPYNGPYGLGESLNRPARNRFAETYADAELPSFPRGPLHPWLKANRAFVNNVQAMRRYAAEISGVEDGVGRVMKTLARLGLDERTVVIFTADQGLCAGQNGMWGMSDHSRPMHAFDCTIHIPLIWRQPGRVKAGQRLDPMVSNYDFMPTLLSYLGLGDKSPRQPESPGRDYAPALRGEPLTWDDAVFFDNEDTRAIRTTDWKLIRRHPDGPDELYDLAHDPGETQNLIEDESHAATRAALDDRLRVFFARYTDPKYDLWRGGRSKSHLLTLKLDPLPPPGHPTSVPR